MPGEVKQPAHLWGWKGRRRAYTKLMMPKRLAAVVACRSRWECLCSLLLQEGATKLLFLLWFLLLLLQSQKGWGGHDCVQFPSLPGPRIADMPPITDSNQSAWCGQVCADLPMVMAVVVVVVPFLLAHLAILTAGSGR